ncbi:unnamed protein product, partial [Aphanomyces euteiches]
MSACAIRGHIWFIKLISKLLQVVNDRTTAANAILPAFGATTVCLMKVKGTHVARNP